MRNFGSKNNETINEDAENLSAGKNHAGIIIIAILLVLAVVIASGMIYILSVGKAYDKNNTELIAVEIPMGSSSDDIAQALEKSGVIKSASEFNLKSRLTGNRGSYKAGNYELSPSMTMEEIMEQLKKGSSGNTLRFTVPEGSSLTEIAEVVAATGACTSEEFLQAAAEGAFDYEFLKDNDITGEKRLEGFLYPDTYDIYENEKPDKIIERMLKRFDEIYSEVLKTADTDIMNKYNTFEIVTVASLIEKEAKLDKERPLVASVVYNRLDKNMKLQFCSTVQYALGKHKARLYNSDLKVESPYNTYKYEGLPQGPIGSPGRASLEAAVSPEHTDYLFFVVSAKGDGSHNFAATGDEFGSYKDEYLASLAG